MFLRTVRQHLSFLKVCNPHRSYNFLDKNEVVINDRRVTSWDAPVDAVNDVIVLNGNILPRHKFTYLALNKPCGYVCSTVSDRSKTVYDLIPSEYRNLRTVGRLDKDTSGLIVLTDDGVFSHWLTSPEANIKKTYHVWLADYVSPWEQYDYEVKCKCGIFLPACEKSPAFTAAGAKLEWLDAGLPELGCCASVSECLLTIHEGKFHQVRRMFKALGNDVTKLKRIAIGNLELRNLEEGEFRLIDTQLRLL